MNRLPYALFASAIAFQPMAAVAAEPLVPIKPWNLDYGETNCVANRTYGTEAKPILFALRPSPRGNVVQIVLMRRGGGGEAEHVPVTVKLSGAELKTTGLRHASSDGKYQILRINLPWAAMDQIRNASTIEVEAHNAADGVFSVPGMAKVVTAMEECNKDLQAYWNIGDERTAQFKTFATSDRPLSAYLESSDYPDQAIRERREGTVRVTLMVDEKGTLRDCGVEETSSVAVLDTQTCVTLIKRAKFQPAVNISGEPVRSVLSAAVRWVLP